MADETKKDLNAMNDDMMKQLEAMLRSKGVDIKISSLALTDVMRLVHTCPGKLRELYDKLYTNPEQITRAAARMTTDLRPVTSVQRKKMTNVCEAAAHGATITEDPWIDWIRDISKSTALDSLAHGTWSLVCSMIQGEHGVFSTAEVVELIKCNMVLAALAFLQDHIRGDLTHEQVEAEFEKTKEHIRQRDAARGKETKN